MRRFFSLLVPLTVACSTVEGSKDAGHETPDAGIADGGSPDAGTDAGPIVSDAGLDAGPDAGMDAGLDAGVDDAGIDGGSDAGPDAGDAGFTCLPETPGGTVFSNYCDGLPNYGPSVLCFTPTLVPI